jgi:hypothetical protein
MEKVSYSCRNIASNEKCMGDNIIERIANILHKKVCSEDEEY